LTVEDYRRAGSPTRSGQHIPQAEDARGTFGVFEEEFAQLGDDRAALERTALRFGNPAEVWSWSKYGRLANLAADDTDQLAEQVIDELIYLKQHPDLLASFVDKTELKLVA
jgi:hypothetical protein